jgi:hypothetical protein
MRTIKGYAASAAVAGKRFAKFAAADAIAQAAASTDPIIGVTDLGGAAGDMIDVTLLGPAKITCGGAVTRGNKLTADADGKAIPAAPAAGVNAQTGAFALSSGVAGDIIDVIVLPGAVQG